MKTQWGLILLATSLLIWLVSAAFSLWLCYAAYLFISKYW